MEIISVLSPQSVDENKSTPISLSDMEIIPTPRSELVVKNKSISSSKSVLGNIIIQCAKSNVQYLPQVKQQF